MGRGSEARRRASAAVSPNARDIAIYICRDPVDFRMGINGLRVVVEATLKYDPFSRNLFCFANKRRNQPFHLEGPVVELDEEQFRWLLDGLDLKHLKPHRTLEYRTVL